MFSAYLSRKTTKDRETVNYLMKMLDETELEDCSREILKKEQEDSSISVIATLPHNDKGRIAIKRVLSHYETLATGVNNHIFNEKMLMDASISKTITLYNTCIPYIRKIRDEGQKSAYCEFEEMAERWKTEKKRRDPSSNNL